jgi:hypothetical protein
MILIMIISDTVPAHPVSSLPCTPRQRTLSKIVTLDSFQIVVASLASLIRCRGCRCGRAPVDGDGCCIKVEFERDIVDVAGRFLSGAPV